MMYIVSQFMTNEEREKLNLIFSALDSNGDGTLTQEELIEGYTKLYGDKSRAIAEVNCLMGTADVDGNGVIDYTGMLIKNANLLEFLVAAANKTKLVSKANVKQAFDIFDQVAYMNYN